MPDTHTKGDEKSEHISEEKRFAGEYVNLARYIGFSAFQKKVVSCTITGGLPVLLFGSFCFLLSFFVTSLSSCSESTLNAERFYKNPESMSGIIQTALPFLLNTSMMKNLPKQLLETTRKALQDRKGRNKVQIIKQSACVFLQLLAKSFGATRWKLLRQRRYPSGFDLPMRCILLHNPPAIQHEHP